MTSRLVQRNNNTQVQRLMCKAAQMQQYNNNTRLMRNFCDEQTTRMHFGYDVSQQQHTGDVKSNDCSEASAYDEQQHKIGLVEKMILLLSKGTGLVKTTTATSLLCRWYFCKLLIFVLQKCVFILATNLFICKNTFLIIWLGANCNKGFMGWFWFYILARVRHKISVPVLRKL